MIDEKDKKVILKIIIASLLLFVSIVFPPIGIILIIIYLLQKGKLNKSGKYKKEDQKRINELKGDQFENFVEKLFNEEEFVILNRTEDLMRTKKGFHEEDTMPDFLINHIITGQEFYVECKYRSKLFNNKYNWSNYKQMCRYMRYALENKIPCFVILGLDGTANNPKEIYGVPIEKMKYPELYPSQFEQYYHNPKESFKWDGKLLK